MDKTTHQLLMSSYVVPPITGLVNTSYSKSYASQASPFVVNFPVGTQTGDLLVMVIQETTSTNPPGISGWTERHVYTTGNGTVKIYSRVADSSTQVTFASTSSWAIYTFAFRNCAWQNVAPVSLNTSSTTVTGLIPVANGLRFIVATLRGYDDYSRSPAIPEVFLNNYFEVVFGINNTWGVDVILGGDTCTTGVQTSSVVLTPIQGASNNQTLVTHTTFLISTL